MVATANATISSIGNPLMDISAPQKMQSVAEILQSTITDPYVDQNKVSVQKNYQL